MTYEYFADGERYTGKRISPFDGEVAFSGQGERVATDYPEGAAVLVAHHPRHKPQSLLRPGPGLFGWSVIGTAVLLAVVAVLTLFQPAIKLGMLLGMITAYGAFLSVVKAVQLATAGDASATFLQTPGVITSSKVITSKPYEHRDPDRMLQSSHFSPEVRYSYEVGGQTFESDRVQVGQGMASNISSFAEETVAHYAVGSAVTVFYDARNPARAVLVPGASGGGTFFGVLFALAFAMATPIVMWLF